MQNKFEKSGYFSDIINVNDKKNVFIELIANVNNIDYVITRTINSQKKQADVKIVKIINGIYTNIEGNKKTDTEKVIKEIFGEYSNFLSLCVTMQDGQHLLNLSDKDKYKMLANLLNIEKYKKMHIDYLKKVKKNKSNLDDINLQLFNFNNEIQKEEEIKKKENELIEQKKECLLKINTFIKENGGLENEFNKIDIKIIKTKINEYKNITIESNEKDITNLTLKLIELEKKYTDK